MSFPRFGTPRLGPVSGFNLLRKREATLLFLHTHHEDLKHAIELAGPNRFNAQETWQRVFRDAERAVLRSTAAGFPELGYLPAAARDAVLWRRFGFAGANGVYPTVCDQYRASMNQVADWASRRGLMDHAGAECIPRDASLLQARMADPARVAVLQRQDGFGPDLTIAEPAVAETPSTQEIEDLLHEVRDVRHADHGPAPRALRSVPGRCSSDRRSASSSKVIEGRRCSSIADGVVEVRRREADGSEWLVETMGPRRGGRRDVPPDRALPAPRRCGPSRRPWSSRSVARRTCHWCSTPEWVDELAAVMEARLVRRAARIAELQDAGTDLRTRIRRTLFG